MNTLHIILAMFILSPVCSFAAPSESSAAVEAFRSGLFSGEVRLPCTSSAAPSIVFTEPAPFCSSDYTCEVSVEYAFQIDSDCAPDELVLTVYFDPFLSGDLESDGITLSGTYPDYVITGDFEFGDHAFVLSVQDTCGDSSQVNLPFSVADCYIGPPFCINGMPIDLMPADLNGDGFPDPGTALGEVWVSDFLVSPGNDCSGPLQYSGNLIGEVSNPNQSGIEVNCDDLGVLEVEIWTWDAAGNSDFCITYLGVQDPLGICGLDTLPCVGGTIFTPSGDVMPDIDVSLTGSATYAMTTSNDGRYVFNNLLPSGNYTISAQKDGGFLSGVSTMDLLQIQKHVLGIERLDSPYQLIAADLNGSGTVTALDLVLMRRAILAIDTEVAGHWRFIDASYVFPDPSNPWAAPFPEAISISGLPAAGLLGLDFIGVQMGRVAY